MLSHFFEQMINLLEIVARFLFHVSDLLKSLNDQELRNYALGIFVCMCLVLKKRKKRVYES